MAKKPGKGKPGGKKKPFIGRWRRKKLEVEAGGSHIEKTRKIRRLSRGKKPKNVIVKIAQKKTWGLKRKIDPKKHVDWLKRLKKLGIPTEEVLKVLPKKGAIVSKDYSKGGTHKTSSPALVVYEDIKEEGLSFQRTIL